MTELPKDKKAANTLLKELYDKFTTEGLSKKRAIEAIVEEVGKKISIRTLWTYAAEWYPVINKRPPQDKSLIPRKKFKSKRVTVYEKKRSNKETDLKIAAVINSQFHHKQNIEWLDPTAEYTDKQIKDYVVKVCNELSLGNGLMATLDSMAISLFLFERWVDLKEEYYLMHKRAESQGQKAFMVRSQEAMKRVVSVWLSNEDIVEESIMYEYVEVIDEESGEKHNKEVPKYRTVKKKPGKPDTQTIKVVYEMMKEIARNTSNTGKDDIDAIMAMSEAQLKEMIHELENQIQQDDQNRANEPVTEATVIETLPLPGTTEEETEQASD